jgi:Mn-dependent DtxR family transcriptional regulator
MNMHNQKKILSFLEKKRVITSSELAKYLGVSWNTAEKYLLELGMSGGV